LLKVIRSKEYCSDVCNDLQERLLQLESGHHLAHLPSWEYASHLLEVRHVEFAEADGVELHILAVLELSSDELGVDLALAVGHEVEDGLVVLVQQGSCLLERSVEVVAAALEVD